MKRRRVGSFTIAISENSAIPPRIFCSSIHNKVRNGTQFRSKQSRMTTKSSIMQHTTSLMTNPPSSYSITETLAVPLSISWSYIRNIRRFSTSPTSRYTAVTSEEQQRQKLVHVMAVVNPAPRHVRSRACCHAKIPSELEQQTTHCLRVQ